MAEPDPDLHSIRTDVGCFTLIATVAMVVAFIISFVVVDRLSDIAQSLRAIAYKMGKQ